MIYLKLILALLLSALPFFYVSYVRPKEKTSPVWRNLFTALATQMPRLRAVKKIIGRFLHRIGEGMKKSDNFRKFFSLVTLLLMVVVQFVDFSASQDVAQGIRELNGSAEQTKFIAAYGSLMTRPHASVLAACLSLMLFSYKAADWLLTRLHNRKKFFLAIALLTLVILFASPRYFIVAEVLHMMLLAALVYPNRTSVDDPKGRKRIPKDERQEYRKAA